MNRITRVNQNYYAEGYMFDCPGCGEMHAIPVRHTDERIKNRGTDEPKWGFNGSLERPTFTPSLLVQGYDGDTIVRVCHSFVRDGQIQFLGDCTHPLKGQTVDLPEVSA